MFIQPSIQSRWPFLQTSHSIPAEIFPSYSISPALPAGLSLNPATGVISGTPLAPSPRRTYTITGTNSGGSTTGILSIEVPSSAIEAYFSAGTNCDGPSRVNFTPGGAPVVVSLCLNTKAPHAVCGTSIGFKTGIQYSEENRFYLMGADWLTLSR